jgi:hypothetical protein
MVKGEDVHTDQAGVLYDPFDFINEFIVPVNDDGSYYYNIFCPICKKKMYSSNEPCRLLPLRPCSKCTDKINKESKSG